MLPQTRGATMDRTTDELSAAVEATLATWRAAFAASPSHSTADPTTAGDGRGAAPPTPVPEAPSPPSRTPAGSRRRRSSAHDALGYRRRLATFAPRTYFAKPLSLSPLVCAALGWENTGTDIIKCRHANCGATLCISFHPRLDAASRDHLCQRYVDLLASSHAPACPCRSFASRWSKVLRRSGPRGEVCERAEITTGGSTPQVEVEESRHNEEEGAKGSDSTFYVPPYLLSLSGEFLRFEDSTIDGSLTRQRVREAALQNHETLRARSVGNATFDVRIPDEVTMFCRQRLPDVDVETLLSQNDRTLTVPYLLSSFGWAPCSGGVEEQSGLIVQCRLCRAHARLAPAAGPGAGPGKRRRVEPRRDARLALLGSHRSYCPYVAGFARGPGHASEAGWTVVMTNLLKSAPQTSSCEDGE